MKYLLIVWIWVGNGTSPTTVSGDFISLESCNNAAKTVRQELKQSVKSYRPHRVKTWCLKK